MLLLRVVDRAVAVHVVGGIESGSSCLAQNLSMSGSQDGVLLLHVRDRRSVEVRRHAGSFDTVRWDAVVVAAAAVDDRAAGAPVAGTRPHQSHGHQNTSQAAGQLLFGKLVRSYFVGWLGGVWRTAE